MTGSRVRGRRSRAFDGRLVMAWKSSHDEQIYWSTFDGTNWSSQAAIPGRATSHAPALAAFGNVCSCFRRDPGKTRASSLPRCRLAISASATGYLWSGRSC
jgi:hypothetical protein